jgi:hypothetical protein
VSASGLLTAAVSVSGFCPTVVSVSHVVVSVSVYCRLHIVSLSDSFPAPVSVDSLLLDLCQVCLASLHSAEVSYSGFLPAAVTVSSFTIFLTAG